MGRCKKKLIFKYLGLSAANHIPATVPALRFYSAAKADAHLSRFFAGIFSGVSLQSGSLQAT
jgi:hypothetical protein